MCQEEVDSTDVQSPEFTIVHDNTTVEHAEQH